MRERLIIIQGVVPAPQLSNSKVRPCCSKMFLILVSTPLRSSGKDTACRKGLRVSIVQVASGHIAVLDALNTAAAQP